MGEDLAADLVRRAGMNGCSVRVSPSLQPPRRVCCLPPSLTLSISVPQPVTILYVYIHTHYHIIVWSGKRA